MPKNPPLAPLKVGRWTSSVGRSTFPPAFTLVELLTVIAIIALLAGLLSPSLAAARKRGYATACMSNLKQIGTAFQMYWDNNEGDITGLSGIFPLWSDVGTTQVWTKLSFLLAAGSFRPGRPTDRRQAG